MRDSTITVYKDNKSIDIYTNDVFYYADKFLQDNNIDRNDYRTIKRVFPYMVLTIHDNCIGNIDNNNIELLDQLFDLLNKLCIVFNYNITIYLFSIFVGINSATLTDWNNREYRVSNNYSKYTKRWINACRDSLVNDLNNSDGTSANKIFIAKAQYGLAETAPIQVKSGSALLAAEELPQLDTIDSTGNIAQ